MYRLYIANKNYSSWSMRPWALMHELDVPFAEEQVWFTATDNYDRFRAFAPNGQVPCLHDGNTVVWDTLGIAAYLAERHAGVWPADAAARTWAQCATAEMHSGFSTLRTRCTMNCGIRVALFEMPDALRRDIARLDELWRDGLARFGGPFLAGPTYTAVDAFFAPVLFRIQTYGLVLGDAAMDYQARMLARPAMEDWYRAALAETAREPGHEADAAQFGRIVADHRAMAV